MNSGRGAAESVTFAVMLRRHRLDAGLTQEALARRAGLSLRGLSDLERGVRRYPRVATVQRLAAALWLSDADRDVLMRRRFRPATAVGAQAARPRTNLPVPLTSFIGREHELATIQQLLGRTRLLTLTGPGGCGKTRLALQVASALGGPESRYPDGIWLVELAALDDSALLIHAVATALGLRVQGGGAAAGSAMSRTGGLTDRLRMKRLLLVLDNCEHLVEASAALAARLLRDCPRVQILATSREPLGLAGETVWQVPLLAVPENGLGSKTTAYLAGHDAIRLFVERARATLPSFDLHDKNALDVAQICRRLDGMPLAIELAAAMVRHLSPGQIVARLDDRFRLLTSDRRASLPRHQTLRRAIDWSHDQLSEAERTLFRRLAVFAGSWTLEAAAAIAGVGAWVVGDEGDHVDTLEVLARLVDKSLVLAEQSDGNVRYRLLETIRHYGLERLRAAGEEEPLRRRHRDWFLALAERAWCRMHAPDQAEWLIRLEAEHDNVRAALTWSRGDSSDAELRLAWYLSWFWWRCGHLSEGRAWVQQALAREAHPPSSVRAGALNGAGLLERAQGDHAAARASFEASLAIYRGLDDRWGTAVVLQNLAATVEYQGDSAQAQWLVEQSLALHRELGDTSGIASALGTLGQIRHRHSDYTEAEVLLEESLALSRASGDTWRTTVQLGRLGTLRLDLGQHARAVALLEESLALKRGLGDRPDEAWMLGLLGRAATEQGDLDRALARLIESLTLFRELDLTWGIAICLEYLARVVTLRGQPERAIRLLGAAELLRENVGTPRPPVERTAHESRLTALRTRLGRRRFVAAWGAGRTMSLDEAIDDALTPDGRPTPHPMDDGPIGSGTPQTGDHPTSLTASELDVLRLVARGLRNAEVGERLVLSPHTVHRHVANILRKLGLPTRTAAAIYASRHGLL